MTCCNAPSYWCSWFGWACPLLADGRTWTDSTGNYHVEADLIGFNDATVVLKKENRQLVAVPIDKLSKEDQAYLESKEAVEQARQSADAMQTWTMASGLKVVGRVVDYARRDVTIQRRYGKIYVNDRLFDNLPEVYQKMLPKIVSHFEKTQIDDKRAFDSWAAKLRGEPRTFTCEGVLLELENGDEYGVPFFFFSKDDLKVLQPGWQRWLAADKDRAKQRAGELLAADAGPGLSAGSDGQPADRHDAASDAGIPGRLVRPLGGPPVSRAAAWPALRCRSSCPPATAEAPPPRRSAAIPASWPGRSAK